MPVYTRSSKSTSMDHLSSTSTGGLLEPPLLSLQAAAIPEAAPLHAGECRCPRLLLEKQCGLEIHSGLQLLPEELLESVLDHLLHMDKNLADGLSEPLPQFYCTNRATRTAILQWQRREGGAAEQARIGAADIKLLAKDKDGLGALEQLTRSFPRLAALRRLHLRRRAAPKSHLDRFLSQPGTKEKLATVLELELGMEREDSRPGQPLSSHSLCALCLACPLLATLKLALPIQGLSCLLPLNRLNSLGELVVAADALRGSGGKSPADLAALGSLTSLTKLSIFTHNLSTLLPGLSSLSLLSDLSLESDEETSELLSSPVPEFSTLARLQHLTHLQWACDRYGEEMCDITLSALCCCTQLVSLAIPTHNVQPQQLLLMPRLKRLAVLDLDMSQPLSLAQGCSLETLELLDVPPQADLAALLPLCRAVKLLELPTWLSEYPYVMSAGPAHSVWQVSVEAHRVGIAAQALEELTSLCQRAVGELEITWKGSIWSCDMPRHTTSAVIAALSPLGGQLRKIILSSWVLDQALVEQLAGTLPGLKGLCLCHCLVCLDAWECLLHLTQLSHLELSELRAAASGQPTIATAEDRDAFLGYAVAVQQDLTVTFLDGRSRVPFSYKQVAARWEQAVGECRRAAGASGCVRIEEDRCD